MSTSLDTGRARAWAWVAHLRSGGTTPWGDWTATDATDEGRFLPGAQQLELLRRLNLATRPAATLVERVLGASAPGRGRPDLELVGVDEERRFGPRPVDPADLPDDELLRVATGLLAEDLVAQGPRVPVVRRPRRLRIRYELAGDPWLAAAATEQLVAAGRPPGGGGRAVHVLGADVPTMLAHVWATAAFGAGAPAWPDFLARVRARRRLPDRVDLPAVVDRFSARPHTGRVGVVLDPARLPALVGARRLGPRLAPAPELAGVATELARQVGAVLSLHVRPEQQRALLTTRLRPRLASVAGAPPAVTPEHRDWVEDAAVAMRQRLLRARYPVVGDPDRLLPLEDPRPGVTGPESGPVLDLAIELLAEEAT